jgi:hypothetical protein
MKTFGVWLVESQASPGLNKYRGLPRDKLRGSPLHQWGQINVHRLGTYWTESVEVPLRELSSVRAVVQSKSRLRSIEDARASGEETPPIELAVYEDGSAWIVDGNHRLSAARRLKLATIPVIFTFVGR